MVGELVGSQRLVWVWGLESRWLLLWCTSRPNKWFQPRLKDTDRWVDLWLSLVSSQRWSIWSPGNEIISSLRIPELQSHCCLPSSWGRAMSMSQYLPTESNFAVVKCVIGLAIHILTFGASLVAQQWRIFLPVQEMRVWYLGWEDSLEQEKATLSNELLWSSYPLRSTFRPWI